MLAWRKCHTVGSSVLELICVSPHHLAYCPPWNGLQSYTTWAQTGSGSCTRLRVKPSNARHNVIPRWNKKLDVWQYLTSEWLKRVKQRHRFTHQLFSGRVGVPGSKFKAGLGNIYNTVYCDETVDCLILWNGWTDLLPFLSTDNSVIFFGFVVTV